MAPIRHARTRTPSSKALDASASAPSPPSPSTSSAPLAEASAPPTRRASTRNKPTETDDEPVPPPTAAVEKGKAKAKPPPKRAARGRARARGKGKGKAPPSSASSSRGTRSSARGGKKNDEDEGEEQVESAAGSGGEDGPRSEEDEEDEGMHTGEKEQDLTLYCICLGFDSGEQSMIQCEHCENWFHFQCIGLSDAESRTIEAYCCDICEGMGMGYKTRYVESPEANTFQSSPQPNDGEDDDENGDDGSDAHMTSDDDAESDDAASSDAEVDEDDLDEDEYGSGEEGAQSGRRRKRSMRSDGPVASKRARKSSAAKSKALVKDDDYTGDEESALRDQRRRRPSAQVKRTASTSAAKPSSSSEAKSRASGGAKSPEVKRSGSISAGGAPEVVSSTPASDKTRTAVVTQLTTIFQSIFAASEEDTNSITVKARAAGFAESVETIVFDGFAEVDAKGVRGPRQKYLAKFRSLHYNLKSNAAFRSRISANELDATQIVNMSQEDLLTPELRAMADNIRAASLKHSVKEVLSAPKAKHTHKGEVEIDNYDTGAAAEDERRLDQQRKTVESRERSVSMGQGSPTMAQSPTMEQFSPGRERSPPFAFEDSTALHSRSPTVDSPVAMAERRTSVSQSPGPAGSLPERQRSLSASTGARGRTSISNVSLSASDFGLDVEELEDSPAPELGSAREQEAEGDSEMKPPPVPAPRSRASFDMASVWGQVKPSPTLAATEQMESTSENDTDAQESEEAFDPFFGARDSNDDFEASFLRDEPMPSTSKLPVHPAPAIVAPTPPSSKPLSDLESVWVGDLIVPDEGGFPANGVQLGGRPFGTSPQLWNQLLPRLLSMDGRLPTSAAAKYLVECSFAPTRELIVVGLLPDQTGPTESHPTRPTGPSCLLKHAHIIDFYVKRDRVGVIQPPQAMRKIVKDVYIIPLKTKDALPEYVELLDDHGVPETGMRNEDLLLCVLVVQKGSLPSLQPPPPPAVPSPPPTTALPISAPSTKSSADSAPQLKPYTSLPSQHFPTAPHQNLSGSGSPLPAGVDNASLQALLQSVNPTFLQSLSASSSTTAIPAAAPKPAFLSEWKAPSVPSSSSSFDVGVRPPPGPINPHIGPGHYGGAPPGFPPPAASNFRRPDSDYRESASPPRGKVFVHPSRMGIVPETEAARAPLPVRGGGFEEYPPAPRGGYAGEQGGNRGRGEGSYGARGDYGHSDRGRYSARGSARGDFGGGQQGRGGWGTRGGRGRGAY